MNADNSSKESQTHSEQSENCPRSDDLFEAVSPGPAVRAVCSPPSVIRGNKRTRLLLIACGALAVAAAVWLSSSSFHTPNPRNLPALLLTVEAATASTNLPLVIIAGTNIPAGDLLFGQQQVRRMVQDRPEMARYVTPKDELWQYCERGFGGAAIGRLVLWDNKLPADNVSSEHMYPYNGGSAFIRIRVFNDSAPEKGKALSCEELWSCAVFELENLKGFHGFQTLFERALAGELTREQFIRGNSWLEYGALRRTAKDYVQLWRPLAVRDKLPYSTDYWGLQAPDTYEEWITSYWDPKGYPWSVYGSEFDEEIIPYLKATGHWPAKRKNL